MPRSSNLFTHTAIGRFALACLIVTTSTTAIQAADTVSYLPRNTLGYVVVRNIAESDQKLAKFTSLFNPGVPSPLALAKAITGLEQGVDFAGNALFAYLANSNSVTVPTPLVLLPVTDYEVFAAAVGGDATGEICRIRIAEIELLVARLGKYALVMNVEHRDLMRQVLATRPEAAADSFTGWIAENDISVVLTRFGLAYIAKYGWFVGAPASEEIFAEDDFGEIVIAEGIMRRESWPLVDFARRNFQGMGLGLAIDDASNTRLRWKGELLEPIANSQQPAESPQQRLMGFAAKPYALAGGGDLPTRASEMLAEFMTSLSLQDAQQQGRTEFTRQDWAEERRSWDLAFGGVQEVSFLLVPPTEGEPLLSTFFARLTVEDSAKYLASLTQSYEMANELTTRSKSEIKMLYDVIPKTIGDVEGLAITTDLDKATGDQNVEAWQVLLTACLGTEHQLAIYLSPVDEKYVFVGLQSTDKLLEFIKGFREAETGLANETAVQRTLALVDAEVPFLQLVNPQGLVEITRSWMKTFLVLGMVPQLPLYPSTPPIAISLASDQLSWQGEAVFPEETVQGLAAFVANLEKMFGQ